MGHAGRGKGYIQHMVRFAVTVAVAALLALTGCGGSQEREKKEQEAAAAEKKVAESRAFLEQLEREKKLLDTRLTEAHGKLTESRGLLHRTLAGAAYLAAEQDSGGLVIDVDMASARDGFLLEQAARAKDHEAVSELAARALDDQRPCVRTPAEEQAQAPFCPPCQVDPYEDACVGVATHFASTPEWSCATLARTAQGLPPTAFCTSEFQHPAPEGNVKSPYAERNLSTSLRVARVAFAYNGRLHVSDYPAPDRFLYNPPAVESRALCERNTERNKCIYECEVSHVRYEDPCACEEPSREPEEEEEEPYGDTPDESVQEEDPEVREAREAAAEAEAEAEQARERAAEAQKELQYQECLTSCDSNYEPGEDAPAPSGSGAEDGEPRARPTSSEVNVRLEATPAPGIFLVSRELRVLGAKREVIEASSLTVVLRHPALVALWRKKPLPEGELGSLEEVGQLDTVTTEGGKASLVSLPGVEGTALVGLLEDQVKGYAFNTQPGQEPVVALTPAAVCEAVRAEPKRFPQRFQDACAKLTPAASPEADAGVPEGPADAGTPESPADAGTTASPADAGQGEVAP